MVKSNKYALLRSVSFVLLFLFIEATALLVFYPGPKMTGFSVVNLSEAYSKLYPGSKVFLVIQWVVIAIVLLSVYLKNINVRKRTEEVNSVDLASAMKGAKTKLDAFYTILKQKKRLSVKGLADLFNISPDLAMEWSRILETGNLAFIEYPNFGSPIVNVVEKNEKLIQDNPLDKGT